MESLKNELSLLLNESKVREFKWKELDGAKERFAAIKMLEFTVAAACAVKLRVDVLIWDIRDSRHDVQGRDDLANLQRMYYHLFRNVLRTRWPQDAVWRLHPDEHTAMDWKTVQDCLGNVRAAAESDCSFLPGDQFCIGLRQKFGIEEIQPARSDEHPLLQLADLFAGLATFSHEKFNEYENWQASLSPQAPLPTFKTNEPVDVSRASQERFEVLRSFDEACKKRKLGVSLRKKRTLDPRAAEPD